ncbi:hypothetical protein DLAC_06496 [Tieghemostelium lacteum]|uniref:Uncharacterized protein n=1 Tax=Tieghemostelium lacteum TaxID=361077 RepID=A0A151ZEW8_TIELA|nr:hypothetical protein DLAC_06496 [Tieghemostelium lacteum]|eukprot:KYQ92506.1 hypothetical protein DLAC_06496 [Tieghemostelium lacteum]
MNEKRLQIIEKLLLLEINWWKSNCQLADELTKEGYNTNNLLFFSEILFLLESFNDSNDSKRSPEKSMVLISEFKDEKFFKSYLENVLIESGLFREYSNIRYQIINCLTTTNCQFEPALIVYNSNSMKFQQLLGSSINTIQNNTQNDQHFTLELKEIVLSQLLDYPYPLCENYNSDNSPVMLDIGYFFGDKLVTSYYLSNEQLQTRKHIEHFQIYSRIFINYFNIPLKLKISNI